MHPTYTLNKNMVISYNCFKIVNEANARITDIIIIIYVLFIFNDFYFMLF